MKTFEFTGIYRITSIHRTVISLLTTVLVTVAAWDIWYTSRYSLYCVLEYIFTEYCQYKILQSAKLLLILFNISMRKCESETKLLLKNSIYFLASLLSL